MSKKYDVIALGELLVDFTDAGVSDQGNSLFQACPGGAPCNVLAMLRKLGYQVGFIGKIGNDMFGTMLKEVVEQAGIDTQGLLMSEDVRTTLAFVKTFADGDRDFSFYRNPGADMMLEASELNEEQLKDTRVFHFGTLSMTHEGVREATKKAVKIAKESGALISFDPNLRAPLWASLEDAEEQIRWGLSVCDVLKIADNEIEFLTGETDIVKGAQILKAQYPTIQIFNATAGPDGSYSLYKDTDPVFVPSFKLGGTIETTGAGDTFCASALHFVLTNGTQDLTPEQRKQMLTFANAAAYIVTTKKGAIKAMPERSAVDQLIAENC